MSTPSSLLRSAAASASYNMVLQLMFRALTFVVNACILRYVTSDVLGVVNVRLTLLYTTIMYLSREPFKRACMANTSTSSQDWRQIINMVWCSVPCAMVFSVGLTLVWMYCLSQPDPETIPFYHLSVCLFALSTIVEITAEPLWSVARSFMFIKLKVIVEGAMVTTRCLLTIILLMYLPHLGLLAFTLAHLVGTFVFPFLYTAYFAYYIASTKKEEKDKNFPLNSIMDSLPKSRKGKPFFSTGLVNLTWSFFKQSWLKQILSEGERYAMTVTNILNFSDQGMYDIVSNLGSLVARFVFYPVEDSAYVFFSQSLVRGEPAKKQKKESLKLSCDALEILLTMMTLIGLTMTSFGFAYSRTLMFLYGGTMLSDSSAPMLLRWFFLYVSFIAVNGVTESFVFSAMSQAEVDKYNKKMVVFSIAFLTSAYFLAVWLCTVGFILANCLNMFLRICHSLYFINRFVRNTPYRPSKGLIPQPFVLFTYFLSFIITSISEVYLYEKGLAHRFLHIGVGCHCLLMVAGAIFMKQKKMVRFIAEQIQQRRKKVE